ncbi:hypothetical protein [Lacisediminihabitans sp.]|uniref:hypothetical protein n=1 Tax=Lacisediminihabitans sp. TaxID=2787631 RepID=UPI00374D8E88
MTIANFASPPVDEERVLAWLDDQDLVDLVFFELVSTIRPSVVSTGMLALPPLRNSTAGPYRSPGAAGAGSGGDCWAWERSPPTSGLGRWPRAPVSADS